MTANGLATVAAVGNAAARRFSDHGPYIRAVVEALVARDLTVTEVPVMPARSGLRREAMVYVQVDPDAFAYEAPDEAVGFWDEILGWSLIITRQDREVVFFEGTQLVPDPGAVAAWMIVVLTHPGMEGSSGEVRFREVEDSDPEFEAQLARYAPDQ